MKLPLNGMGQSGEVFGMADAIDGGQGMDEILFEVNKLTGWNIGFPEKEGEYHIQLDDDAGGGVTRAHWTGSEWKSGDFVVHSEMVDSWAEIKEEGEVSE